MWGEDEGLAHTGEMQDKLKGQGESWEHTGAVEEAHAESSPQPQQSIPLYLTSVHT